jgi:hypothetical protein
MMPYFETWNARQTDERLMMAYVRQTVHRETADEAMLLPKFKWSRSLYPISVLCNVVVTPAPPRRKRT